MLRWVVPPLQSLSRPVTDCCVCVLSPAQRPADPGAEQGPGAERVSGAGVGPAGPPVPGEASPLPGPLHPLPAGAAGLPERLQWVLILMRLFYFMHSIEEVCR